MPQPKDPRSYPPEISRILWYVYKTGKSVTIPCPTRGAAITLRFRFGGYIASLLNMKFKEYEQLGTLIARDNSKAIADGRIPESEAAVTIEPRSITETTLPKELLEAIQSFESRGVLSEGPVVLSNSLDDKPEEEIDNVDLAIDNLFNNYPERE